MAGKGGYRQGEVDGCQRGLRPRLSAELAQKVGRGEGYLCQWSVSSVLEKTQKVAPMVESTAQNVVTNDNCSTAGARAQLGRQPGVSWSQWWRFNSKKLARISQAVSQSDRSSG